jgi:hypothetical protein
MQKTIYIIVAPSTKVEYLALFQRWKEIIWMHSLMLELGLVKLKELITLLCDNQKVIKLTN